MICRRTRIWTLGSLSRRYSMATWLEKTEAASGAGFSRTLADICFNTSSFCSSMSDSEERVRLPDVLRGDSEYEAVSSGMPVSGVPGIGERHTLMESKLSTSLSVSCDISSDSSRVSSALSEDGKPSCKKTRLLMTHAVNVDSHKNGIYCIKLSISPN